MSDSRAQGDSTTLSYRRLASAKQVTPLLRVVAMAGILVAIDRVLQVVESFHAFGSFRFPATRSVAASDVQAGHLILYMIGIGARGTALRSGCIGILSRQRWGEGLLVVTELCASLFFTVLLVVRIIRTVQLQVW